MVASFTRDFTSVRQQGLLSFNGFMPGLGLEVSIYDTFDFVLYLEN